MLAVDSRLAGDAKPLPILFFATSLVIILAEWRLSGSRPAILAAFQLYGVVLLLFGSAALVTRWTGRSEWGVFFVAGYLGLALQVRTAWLVIPLGVASVIVLRTIDLRTAARRLVNPLMLLAAVVGAALILSVTHYADFLIMEKLFRGDVHQDTLFHASIAAMLKNYGVTSTGLNGLVPLEYHVLSHRMFAGLSLLSGIPVLEIYGIAYLAFVCPLLICAVTWSALRIRGDDRHDPVGLWLISCGLLMTLQLLPLEMFAVWDSYFVSESYTISLVLLLFALPLLVKSESHLDLALAAGLLFLATLAKGSVGLIGLGLLWSKVIFLPGSTRRWKAASIAGGVTFAVAWVLLSMSTQAAANSPLNPFHYAQLHGKVFGAELAESVASLMAGELPPHGHLAKAVIAVALYVLANFLVSWIVLIGRMTHGGWRTLLGSADSLYSMVAVAVALAGLMFEMVGVWYFVNPAMFVSCPFVVVALSRRFVRSSSPVRWASIIALMAGTAFVTSESLEPGRGLHLKTRARLTGRTLESNIATLIHLREKGLSKAVILERGTDFPGRGELWTCDQEPFTYPAVTERAWIGVIDAASDCPYAWYGYAPYFTGQPRALVPPVVPSGVDVVSASALVPPLRLD